MTMWDDKAKQAYSHTYFLQKHKWGYQLTEKEAIELELVKVSPSVTRKPRTSTSSKKEAVTGSKDTK